MKIIPGLSKKDLLKLLLKVLFWYGELKVNKVSRGKCSAAATALTGNFNEVDGPPKTGT